MIEFRLTYVNQGYPNHLLEWGKLPYPEVMFRDDDVFEHIEIRINGVVYTDNTEEFRKIYKQALIWEKLSGI